jgi:tryptophanyl-tRNA synthetase
MPEPIANLFTLLKLVSAPDVVSHFTDAYNRCEIRYGDLKKQLAEDIIAVVAPIRQRIEAIRSDDAYLHRVTSQGAERARESSAATLADVREIMGIHKF